MILLSLKGKSQLQIAKVKIKNAKKLKSLRDISKNSRLFYERGHYIVLRKYIDSDGYIVEDKEWIREGVFIEIKDVDDFIKTDDRLTDKEYIKHHNFVVVD
jgi:hypothetical protein